MPIYSYTCRDCKNTFDLLIGVTSAASEMKCPKCGSVKIDKKLGGFSVRMGSASSSGPAAPSCPTGGCCPTC